MARVRLNEPGDIPEEQRSLFERLEERDGLLNIFRALSHSPEALKRFMRFGTYLLYEGKLDPKLRELAILRVGAVCRSPYEFSQHIGFGRQAGLTDAQIRGVLNPNAQLFGPGELAVVNYAGELSAGSQVSDATYAAVAATLNEEEVVELTLVVGYYNMVSRALNALQVEIDAPAQRNLDALGVEL